MNIWSFFIGIVLLSFWLTRCFKNYALKQQLLDHPNGRSSHDAPIPTSGGVGFILASAIAWLLFQPFALLNWVSASLLLVLAILLAVLGFWDDRKGLPVLLRFGAQIAAAILVLFILNGMPPLEFAGFLFSPNSLVTLVLGVVWIVWLTNLYNFMDGINGLATLEAISVALGLAICLYTPPYINEAGFWLILICALLGFLFWNFPKAAIFMGDVGSVFLGFLFAAFALWLGWQNPMLFWAVVILLATFITDATLTLIKRIVSGQRFYQAHREHAYQRLADTLNSHAKVSIIYTVINLFWLLPIAFMVVKHGLAHELGLALAYLPLILLWCVVVFAQGKQSQAH